MNRDKELARLKQWADKAGGFTGWDLSNVEPRLIDPGPPWRYEDLVREYGFGKKQALDMGTGGGEFVSNVRSALPAKTVATEEWNINAPIAKRRLHPLGVDVVRCKSLKLPFASKSFDLVINRHEELEPIEVARVLASGGHLVTQQVGDNWREFRRFFPRAPNFSRLYEHYVEGLENAGLKLVRNVQHYYKVAYNGLGELIYLLSVAPWEVPGFSLERDLDALLSLEAEQLTEQGLVLTESRFLIIAEK
jgi:SAM-dependent methyltransferase